jgi:hypothetical protein
MLLCINLIHEHDIEIEKEIKTKSMNWKQIKVIYNHKMLYFWLYHKQKELFYQRLQKSAKLVSLRTPKLYNFKDSGSEMVSFLEPYIIKMVQKLTVSGVINLQHSPDIVLQHSPDSPKWSKLWPHKSPESSTDPLWILVPCWIGLSTCWWRSVALIKRFGHKKWNVWVRHQLSAFK